MLQRKSVRAPVLIHARRGKGKGGKGGPGEKPDGCLSVMVMQLSQAVEEDDLWEIFEDCGAARLRRSSLVQALRDATSFDIGWKVRV